MQHLPAMKLVRATFLGALAPSILFVACAVGWNHTSDATLEQIFAKHEPEFEALLAGVQADSQLMTPQPKSLIYAGHLLEVNSTDFSEMERLGLPRERWLRYQKQMADLGLKGGVMKGEGAIEFRVDPGSISNGDSYKGYWYTQTPPGHLRPSLDGYRIADQDKDRFGNWAVYKRIKGNWYLYLFVSR